MVWQPRYQHPRTKDKPVQRLSEEQSISLLYHDIFCYPMKARELVRWAPGKRLKLLKPRPRVHSEGEYFFLIGRDSIVQERLVRESVSRKKMMILSRVKHIFESNRNILMVGITGSLAMAAAHEYSDIDLLIITRKGRLWTTRAKIISSLLKQRVAIRRAGVAKQGDKLCIKIWIYDAYPFFYTLH